jgi:hypothetical protein
MLDLLLELGFDPDERTRFLAVGVDDVVSTWGMPLSHCAGAGKYAMAEMLLKRGADPNASLYASGSPMFQAYAFGDREMVDLLMRYGGMPDATTPGLYRQTELARKMLDREVAADLGEREETLAEQLLWARRVAAIPRSSGWRSTAWTGHAMIRAGFTSWNSRCGSGITDRLARIGIAVHI